MLKFEVNISLQSMVVSSHQTELFLSGEAVHLRIDLPVGTAASIGHHQKIDTCTGRDVNETASVVCGQRLNGNENPPPAVDDSLRA